jgi:putative inorganic carbon (hco3(-)) transporter
MRVAGQNPTFAGTGTAGTISRRGPAGAPRAIDKLYAIRIRDMWRWLFKQPLSFWFVNLYFFFEYVRPQQIYRWLDVLPFAWLFIWLAAGSFVIEGFKYRRWYRADTGLLLFSAIVLLSSFMAFRPDIAYEQLSLYFNWVLVYFLITNIISTEERFLVFTLAFLLYSTKMSQHGVQSFAERGGGFAEWGATGTPGWFQNSGEFGIQMCIFFPIAVYFIQALRPYWSRPKLLVFLFMPVSAIVSIIASSSRGAQLGLVPVVGWMMLKSKHRAKAFALGAALAAAVWLVIPAEQKTRFSEMGGDDTSQSRIQYWKRGLQVMADRPITGTGYKNWAAYTLATYGAFVNSNGNATMQVPHNIFIEAGAELGFPGLLAFVGLIGLTFYTNYQTRKLARRLPGGERFSSAMSHGLDAALWGYLATGFFVTVLYYPFFWINYAMAVALHNVVARKARAAAAAPTVPARVGYGPA